MPWTVMPKYRPTHRSASNTRIRTTPEVATRTAPMRHWGTPAALLSTLAVSVALVVSTAPEQAVAHSQVTPPQAVPKPARTLNADVRPRPTAHHVQRAVQERLHPAVRLHAQHASPIPVSAPRPGPITINVAAVSTAAEAQAAVNRCAGPVEVLYRNWGYADDIVQHNFCGGAWMAFIRPGTRIQIMGGTRPGLYVANGHRRLVPKGSGVAFLAGIGDLALQTCEGDRLAIVGLTRLP